MYRKNTLATPETTPEHYAWSAVATVKDGMSGLG